MAEMTAQEQKLVRAIEEEVQRSGGAGTITFGGTFMKPTVKINNKIDKKLTEALQHRIDRLSKGKDKKAAIERIAIQGLSLSLDTAFSTIKLKNTMMKYFATKTTGVISNAKGRYFEYLVWERLEKMYLGAGGQKDNSKSGVEAENAMKLQRDLVKDLGVDNGGELIQSLIHCADQAAQWMQQNVSHDKIREHILRAMAQSETAGDISAFGINLEIKTSTQSVNGYPDHIKYSTLGDRENYGEGLLSWAEKRKKIDNQIMFLRPSDESFLDKESWITQKIQRIAFQDYCQSYLLQKQSGGSTLTLLNYLLQKGGAGLAFNKRLSKTNKKIVTGITKTANKSTIDFVVVVDLDNLLYNLVWQQNIEQYLKWGVKTGKSGDTTTVSMTYRDNDILQFTTDKKELLDYAGPKPKKNPGSGNEATFLLYLQRGFFELSQTLSSSTTIK